VVLIDGETLANLMIDHSVGVTLEEAYEIKRVDSDYFNEAKDELFLVSTAPQCQDARCLRPTKEDGVELEPELILEDATSIQEAMRRMVRCASDATERLDERIEAGAFDGETKAVELR
jgi:hypothetical protein